MAPKHWVDLYIDDLQDRARTFREYGDERGAKMVEIHIDELRARRTAFDTELITIAEAAALSGYNPESLRRMRRLGHWSGRRADLPRHALNNGSALALVSDQSLEVSDSIADRIRAGAHQPKPRRVG